MPNWRVQSSQIKMTMAGKTMPIKPLLSTSDKSPARPSGVHLARTFAVPKGESKAADGSTDPGRDEYVVVDELAGKHQPVFWDAVKGRMDATVKRG